MHSEKAYRKTRNGGEKLSEKEKDIIKTMAEALPKMSEMDKGYFLGYAEAMVAQKKKGEDDIYSAGKEEASKAKPTFNDIRKEHGLGPVEGGDVVLTKE